MKPVTRSLDYGPTRAHLKLRSRMEGMGGNSADAEKARGFEFRRKAVPF